MRFDSNLPIYIQIMDYIKSQIVTGKLKEGDKLSSVRDLSTELKVNPNTIQRTYQELEREDLVFSQRGMGTFVTEDKGITRKLKSEMATNLVNQFVNNMKLLGFAPGDIIELVKEKAGEGN